jgi:hypothetical protein
MEKLVGLLTSGGDCPGLNAAIRGIGKRRTVPLDHAWIESARSVNTCLGDC